MLNISEIEKAVSLCKSSAAVLKKRNREDHLYLALKKAWHWQHLFDTTYARHNLVKKVIDDGRFPLLLEKLKSDRSLMPSTRWQRGRRRPNICLESNPYVWTHGINKEQAYRDIKSDWKYRIDSIKEHLSEHGFSEQICFNSIMELNSLYSLRIYQPADMDDYPIRMYVVLPMVEMEWEGTTYEVGDMEISIPFSLDWKEIEVRNLSFEDRMHPHPNVGSGGSICWGEDEGVSQAVKSTLEVGSFSEVISLCHSLLSTYGADSPHVELETWLENYEACVECGHRAEENCYLDSVDDAYCQECCASCPNCGEGYPINSSLSAMYTYAMVKLIDSDWYICCTSCVEDAMQDGVLCICDDCGEMVDSDDLGKQKDKTNSNLCYSCEKEALNTILLTEKAKKEEERLRSMQGVSA